MSRKPPGVYTADELHASLVRDAIRGRCTPLAWAVGAYARIGELRRTGPDQAFIAVRDEVVALTGRPMPHE